MMKRLAVLALLAACSAPEPREEAPQFDRSAGFEALLNDTRAEAGLPPVSAAPRLAAAAGDHAADMAAEQFISHTGSDGSDILERMGGRGYAACRGAENIAAQPQDKPALMAQWMDSPDHRANILRNGVSEFGLSRVDQYWVLKLAEPC